jgi:hypothetical protein
VSTGEGLLSSRASATSEDMETSEPSMTRGGSFSRSEANAGGQRLPFRGRRGPGGRGPPRPARPRAPIASVPAQGASPAVKHPRARSSPRPDPAQPGRAGQDAKAWPGRRATAVAARDGGAHPDDHAHPAQQAGRGVRRRQARATRLRGAGRQPAGAPAQRAHRLAARVRGATADGGPVRDLG